MKKVIETINTVTGTKVSVVEEDRRRGNPARLVASSKKNDKRIGVESGLLVLMQLLKQLGVDIERGSKINGKKTCKQKKIA